MNGNPLPRSVLVVQRILPPYRLSVFQELARTEDFSTTIAYGLASRHSALESLIAPPGIKVAPLHNRYLGARELIIHQSGLAKLITSGRFDTIVAEFNPRIITNILAFFRARRRGIRFVWWGHGFRPNSGALARRIYLWLARRADALIFYDAAGAEPLVAQGISRDKVFVAWNSIDSRGVERLARPWNAADRPNLICIGRLIPEKRVDLLIRGFARALPQLNPSTRLVVIGDGPQRSALVELANRLNVSDRVEFAGSIYDEEQLAPWFNTSWLSVSPGYIGLSAIHSLAFGVPMLVADKEPHSPEIAAIEDGVNAIYFGANDEAHLADRIVELSRDPNRLAQMSTAALATIRERFSISVMVDAFRQAIKFAHRSSALQET